jgi:NADH dehydrogenase
MATIGRHAAVAQFPNGRALSGPVGWAAWLALHLVYLIGFRNRANVLVNWSWNYLTYDHASLLIDAEDG